jgi:hypothetical protein
MRNLTFRLQCGSMVLQADSILTADHQLWLFTVGFCALVVFGLVLFYLTSRHIDRRFGPPVPLLRRILSECRAQMRHPHEFAKELDGLMTADEAFWEGRPMNREDRRRMLRLIAEREVSTDPNLRKNETKYATMYLLANSLAQDSDQSLTELTGLTLIGSVAPTEQTLGDASRNA